MGEIETVPTAAPGLTVRRRVVVAAGLLAALLGWLTAAPMEASFAESASGALPYAPDSWAPTYAAVYESVGEPLGLSDYYFWGKFAFLLYVAGLVLVRTLPEGACRRSRIGRTLLFVAFAVGLVGDLLGYWGGTGSPDLWPRAGSTGRSGSPDPCPCPLAPSVRVCPLKRVVEPDAPCCSCLPGPALGSADGEEMTLATDIGFVALEVPAMALMLGSLGLLGLGYRSDGLRPRWTPWLLVAALVLVPAFNALVIGYAPHGVLVPVLLVLTVVVAVARPEPERG